MKGYLDKQGLCKYAGGKCERTIDAWVKQGKLPPAKKRTGLWKIEEVDQYLDDDGDEATESASPYTPEAVREATKALAQR